MNEVTILIIGIGIGYFWAMYRKDNIKVRPKVIISVTPKLIEAYMLGKEAIELERKAAAVRGQLRKEGFDVQTSVKAD